MQKINNTVQLVVREKQNLRREFHLRDVTDAVTLELPVDEVSKSFLEVVSVAQKLVNAVQLVIGLGFDAAMKDADHELSCLWRHTALLRMRVNGRWFIEMSLMADTGGPASSQTETSSPSALKISIALKCCSSQVYLVKEPSETKFDIDIRKNLYVNVELHKDLYAVCPGGTAMFQRIVECMMKELTDTVDDDKSSRRRRSELFRGGKRKKNKKKEHSQQQAKKKGVVGAPLHEVRVIACASNRSCTLSSTSGFH